MKNNNSQNVTFYTKWIPYIICILASLFYAYDFVIRVLPGTIVSDLMSQYSLSPAGLGLLSAFFYMGYMVMQIPCGLFYDRFGPRLLLTIACFIASSATYFFIATHFFTIAAIARLLMGVGSAFAYIGALVLASRWLPIRYYVITAGLIQLMGSLGAILGEAPLAKFVEIHGSQFTIVSIAVIGIVLSALFWLVVRDYPADAKLHHATNYNANILTNLKQICVNGQTWVAALYGFAIWAPIAIFGELWVIPFLTSLYHISNTEAASLASFLWVGVGIGGPIFGWLANLSTSYRIPLMIGSSLGVISSICLLYVHVLPLFLAPVLLFIFGVAGSSQAVTFGVVHDNNPKSCAGTAAGFNNMAIVIGGSLLQPLVGLLLQFHAYNKAGVSIHNYMIADYRFSLVIVPMCFIIAFLAAYYLIREQPHDIRNLNDA